jgi:hypothetical protein
MAQALRMTVIFPHQAPFTMKSCGKLSLENWAFEISIEESE